MRRVLLLALLALALPIAASASSIDFTIGGQLNGTTVFTTGGTTAGNTFTINSLLTEINFQSVPTGKAIISTGVIGAGGTFTNGTVSVWNSSNALLFTGTFSGTVTNTNGVISIIATSGGNPVIAGFQFVVGRTGAVSGDFDVVVTPEPGTLGLLGTGLVGLAGMVRRKIRA